MIYLWKLQPFCHSDITETRPNKNYAFIKSIVVRKQWFLQKSPKRWFILKNKDSSLIFPKCRLISAMRDFKTRAYLHYTIIYININIWKLPVLKSWFENLIFKWTNFANSLLALSRRVTQICVTEISEYIKIQKFVFYISVCESIYEVLF